MITIEDLQEHFPSDLIKLEVNAPQILELNRALPNLLSDFEFQFFVTKGWAGPAFHGCAFRNTSGNTGNLMISDPSVWARGDFYVIKAGLLHFKETGLEE